MPVQRQSNLDSETRKENFVRPSLGACTQHAVGKQNQQAASRIGISDDGAARQLNAKQEPPVMSEGHHRRDELPANDEAEQSRRSLCHLLTMSGFGFVFLVVPLVFTVLDQSLRVVCWVVAAMWHVLRQVHCHGQPTCADDGAADTSQDGDRARGRGSLLN